MKPIPGVQHEILSDIGLTGSEIKVYYGLLELGSTTTGPLIKKAGIAGGKVYLVLDKLVLKGLVTYTIQSGTKHYQAKDPERLLDYLREREEERKQKEEAIKQLIPELKAKYDEHKYQPHAEVFEGVRGFKTFYDWTLKELKKGERFDIMGIPREANERFQSYFTEWNKKRIAKGIPIRLLYNSDSREFGEKRKTLPLTEVRYMKEELETPAWIDVFRDYVVTIIVHGSPVCFLIRNKGAADSYRQYFNILWEQATP